MFIKLATLGDAPIIHELMIKAFMRYKNDPFPSSALEESVESIRAALKVGEQAFISYVDDKPVGMVRFRKTENSIYFFRLSVIPEEQGKGNAKKMLAFLEDYVMRLGVTKIMCKVRQSESNNIKLYRSIGYKAYEESFVEKQNGNMKVVTMVKLLKNNHIEIGIDA